jgi:cytoskeletal protein CcmA (bactofilin family)
MFTSKADKASGKRPDQAVRVPPSLISGDMRITGDLKCSGEVQIDGTVIGDIECGRLMIGENATVEGEITAKEVVIRGQINGLIKAQSVELAKTARVTGDVWHDSLAIEAGAFLDGHCRRNEAPATRTVTAATAVVDQSANKLAPKSRVEPARIQKAVAGT